MKEKEEKSSVFQNPFQLSAEQLAVFIKKNQGEIINKTLVDWHNFAIVSKKPKGKRRIIFQCQCRPGREERLRLISSLIEEGWKEVCLWAMGAIKLEILDRENDYPVRFSMSEQESLSPDLIQFFAPFIGDLNRLLIPSLGNDVQLNFSFSKIEDTHYAYRIKAIPRMR